MGQTRQPCTSTTEARAAPKTRAFSAKVHSGCLTCKKRRKKCDEAKPVCRRCATGGFVCDGYSKQPSRAIQSPPALVFLPPLNRPLLENAQEQRFQHHFFTCTVYDIVDTADSTTFWTSAVTGLHQENAYIRNAIVALGAAHWAFITGSQHNARNQLFVLDQYNQAISGLNKSMTRQHANLQPILTCCLLFVCLETLRGNQSVALQHLEAASRLFLDHLRPGQLGPPLRTLAAAFHSFGNQASLFSESQLMPDLAPFLHSPTDAAPLDRPFATLDEVHSALVRIDDVYNRFYWDEAVQCADYAGKCNCARDCNCDGCRDWAAFKDQVKLFSTCFQPLVERLAATEDGLARRRLLRMQLAENAWHHTITTEDTKDPAGSELYTAEEADEVFHLVEQVLAESASRPVFTLNTDIIPVVVEIYQRCTIPSYRARAIELLRSHARQEVIFNSATVADFLQRDFVLLELVGEDKRTPPTIGPSQAKGALIQFMPHATASS